MDSQKSRHNGRANLLAGPLCLRMQIAYCTYGLAYIQHQSDDLEAFPNSKGEPPHRPDLWGVEATVVEL